MKYTTNFKLTKEVLQTLLDNYDSMMSNYINIEGIRSWDQINVGENCYCFNIEADDGPTTGFEEAATTVGLIKALKHDVSELKSSIRKLAHRKIHGGVDTDDKLDRIIDLLIDISLNTSE